MDVEKPAWLPASSVRLLVGEVAEARAECFWDLVRGRALEGNPLFTVHRARSRRRKRDLEVLRSAHVLPVHVD